MTRSVRRWVIDCTAAITIVSLLGAALYSLGRASPLPMEVESTTPLWLAYVGLGLFTLTCVIAAVVAVFLVGVVALVFWRMLCEDADTKHAYWWRYGVEGEAVAHNVEREPRDGVVKADCGIYFNTANVFEGRPPDEDRCPDCDWPNGGGGGQ